MGKNMNRSKFNQTDSWDAIPDAPPAGSRYGWFNNVTCKWHQTAEYLTLEGNKVEVSEVTDTKLERLRSEEISFVGFVTRCTRGSNY